MPLLRCWKFQRFFEPRPKLTENDTESHHKFRWITTNPVKKRMTHTHCDKSSVEGENIFINKANHAPQMTTTYRPSPALQLIRIAHLRILHWPTPSIVCVGKVYQLCQILSQTWFNLFILSTNNTSLITHLEDTAAWFDPVGLLLLCLNDFHTALLTSLTEMTNTTKNMHKAIDFVVEQSL